MRTVLITLAVSAAWVGACRDTEPKRRGSGKSRPASRRASKPASAQSAFIRPCPDRPGWIDVRCRMTLPSETTIELEFVNTSSGPETFLLGAGRPPLAVEDPSGEVGRPVIRARFARPLEFSAETFNAQPVSLAAGKARKVRLAWRAGDALAELADDGPVPCYYRTMRKAPAGDK